MRRSTRRAAAATAAAVLAALVGLPDAGSNTLPDADSCSTALRDGVVLGYDARRQCVLAVADTWLEALDGGLPAAEVPLADDVARHRLGKDPEHRPGAAEAVRAELDAAPVPAIGAPTWTIDGDVAFVEYAELAGPGGAATRHGATRITLREGRIWEVLENPTSSASNTQATTTRTPFHEAATVAGPMHPPVDMTAPDHDNAAYCSLVLAEEGDEGLAPEEERRCLIAIAATYVDAEGNETADSLTLFDPRFSKYSLGQPANHHPGNGDTNRMDQIALSPTIRLIDDQQWTADPTTDQVWIVYDGYLPVSTDKPGFYVAERFTIRDGLIWEIMISPVIVDVPASLVPQGPPTL